MCRWVLISAWRGSCSALLDWSLLSGRVPIGLRVIGGAAALWLVSRTVLTPRTRSVKIAELTACLVIAAIVTVLLDHLARRVWMLFPDRLDPAVYLFTGVAAF